MKKPNNTEIMVARFEEKWIALECKLEDIDKKLLDLNLKFEKQNGRVNSLEQFKAKLVLIGTFVSAAVSLFFSNIGKK